ncbi:MAG: LPXTG cell wall anchor domain-containing protein [Acidimicrobiales bacterium]|nr:LPXTG cell wall anchor domain-containing protein [Acidimicrobiales bacterium]
MPFAVALGVALLAVCVGLGAPAGAQYPPGQPGFIITPSSTTAGSPVTIAGQGCPPGSTVVFTIDGNQIGSLPVSMDSDGTFSGTIVIPANLAPGDYVVVGTCGNVVMSNTLTILSTELPRTGSDRSLPLAKSGLVLIAIGGLLVLAVRGRRSRAAHA